MNKRLLCLARLLVPAVWLAILANAQEDPVLRLAPSGALIGVKIQDVGRLHNHWDAVIAKVMPPSQQQYQGAVPRFLNKPFPLPPLSSMEQWERFGFDPRGSLHFFLYGEGKSLAFARVKDGAAARRTGGGGRRAAPRRKSWPRPRRPSDRTARSR